MGILRKDILYGRDRCDILEKRHRIYFLGGRNDEKIIAIPFEDPNYNIYQNIDQLPKHVFDEMKHFFSVYKSLENKETAVNEVSPQEEAVKIIKEAIDNYINTFCK